ncbi:MAG: hypothetical protein K0R14_1670 [Burkholderiales bacterium]|jgi:hypothetical protein|nr:hypothetical protein [Burkholderiales bacterium]
MKYLKTLFFLLFSLCLFTLNGCNDVGGKPQTSTTQSANMQDLAKPDNSFSILNDTGKKVAKITVSLSNGQVIYNKIVSCSRICNVKIDESKIQGDLTFNFFGLRDAKIASYFWPYGVGRKMAIGKLLTNTSSNNNLCDPIEMNDIFGGLSGFGALFPPPFNFMAGYLLDIGRGAAADACAAGKGSIQDVVAELSHRVDILDSEMSKAQYDIDHIAQLVNIKDMYNRISSFKSNRDDFQAKVDRYEEIIQQASESSLADFVQDNGGFRHEYESNLAFAQLISSTTSQVNSFDQLLKYNLSGIEDDLQQAFSNPAIMTGDVVSSRINANLIINYLTSKVFFSKKQAEFMLNDEINVVQKALQDGDIDQQWLVSKSMKYFYFTESDTQATAVPWESAPHFLNNLLNTKMQTVKNTLVGKAGGLLGQNDITPNMFPPLGNLPKDFADQLINHKCYIPSVKKDVRGNLVSYNMPFVIKWYANPNTPEGGPNALVNCYNGESFSASTYYYKESGNVMTNIFGKLYAAGFIKKVSDAQGVLLYDSTHYPGVQLSAITLSSNYPLLINSTLVKTIGMDPPHTVTQVEGRTGTSGQYVPVYPPYVVSGDQKYTTLESVVGDASGRIMSTLLAPTDASNQQFIIKLYNAEALTDCPSCTAELNEIVYLRVKKKGVNYDFGLRIVNDSAKASDSSWRYNQRTTLNLVCLPQSQCKVDPSVPTKIIWDDGSFANIQQRAGAGNTIDLSFGNKNSRF